MIARHPSYVPFIRDALTEEAVEKYFQHLFDSKPVKGECRVKRCDNSVMNFKAFQSPEACVLIVA